MRLFSIFIVVMLIGTIETVRTSKPVQSQARFTAEESFNTARFVDSCEGYVTFLQMHGNSAFAGQARELKQRKCRLKVSRVVRSGEKAVEAPLRERTQPVTRSRPASQRPAARSRRSGLCSDGNMDHCRTACRRGFSKACQRLKNTPARLRYSGGTCRTGNMDVCRIACRRWGRPGACARLQRR